MDKGLDVSLVGLASLAALVAMDNGGDLMPTGLPQHRNHFVGLVLSVALVVRVKEVNNILEREKKIGRLRCVSWVGIFPPLWVSFPMSPPWIGFCFVLRIFVLWGSRVRGMWSRLWLS
jgi:hypothetical protein